MARRPELHRHISHLLYARYIGGKGGDHHIAAKRAGVAPETFYDACINRRDLPVLWLPGIYAESKSLGFIAELIDAASMGASLAPLPVEGDEDASLRDAALEVGAASGRTLSVVANATAPDSPGGSDITKDERRDAEVEIERLEKRIAELRGQLRRSKGA